MTGGDAQYVSSYKAVRVFLLVVFSAACHTAPFNNPVTVQLAESAWASKYRNVSFSEQSH